MAGNVSRFVNHKFEVRDDGRILFVRANKSIGEDGGDIVIEDEDTGTTTTLGGSGRSLTEVDYEPLSSAPSNPTVGLHVLADGANWDPTGNGVAAVVYYDTDDSWSVDHEYAGTA